MSNGEDDDKAGGTVKRHRTEDSDGPPAKKPATSAGAIKPLTRRARYSAAIRSTSTFPLFVEAVGAALLSASPANVRFERDFIEAIVEWAAPTTLDDCMSPGHTLPEGEDVYVTVGLVAPVANRMFQTYEMVTPLLPDQRIEDVFTYGPLKSWIVGRNGEVGLRSLARDSDTEYDCSIRSLALRNYPSLDLLGLAILNYIPAADNPNPLSFTTPLLQWLIDIDRRIAAVEVQEMVDDSKSGVRSFGCLEGKDDCTCCSHPMRPGPFVTWCRTACVPQEVCVCQACERQPDSRSMYCLCIQCGRSLTDEKDVVMTMWNPRTQRVDFPMGHWPTHQGGPVYRPGDIPCLICLNCHAKIVAAYRSGNPPPLRRLWWDIAALGFDRDGTEDPIPPDVVLATPYRGGPHA